MLDRWQKKEKPVFTGISRGMGGFGFGKAAAAATSSGIETIAGLNSSATWAVLPNEDHYTSSGIQGTYYNGARFKVSGSNGTVQFNNYEYPMYGKVDLRGGDVSKDVAFQLYGWGGNASQFATGTTEGNMFQMGVYWESSANTDNLTNSLEATSAISGGEAAYIVTDGYGAKTWGFYNGGANNNSQSQGTTNRESQSSVTWANSDQVTFVVYGNSALNSSKNNKIKVYLGETLLRTFTTTVTGGRPLFLYLGGGYPNGMASAWNDALPKFRTASFTGGTVDL
jgi:hypothetical protein